MDHHIKEFYRQSSDEAPRGNFHKVIALHEAPDIDWETIHKMAPKLCKAWFELSHVSSKDRIEFSQAYWLSRFPYGPGIDENLNRFFSSLDDIGVFLTQKKFDDPYVAHLVYSIRGNGGFFRGEIGAGEQEITNLKKFFSPYILPEDYLAFLQIHDGFSKTTDCTGLTRSSLMPESYQRFQSLLLQNEPIVLSSGREVNPKALIPFYESFGMPFYQCFWADWYPENEMGNVYYSGEARTISDVTSGGTSPETMAFATFTEWLMFYLDRFV